MLIAEGIHCLLGNFAVSLKKKNRWNSLRFGRSTFILYMFVMEFSL